VIVMVVGVGDEDRLAADEPGRLALAEALGGLGEGRAEPAQRLQRVGRHCFPLVIMISRAISTTRRRSARARRRICSNASPGVTPSRATRAPLACSIRTLASRARCSWVASSPRCSLCMVLAMVRAARSVKANRASSPSGDQGLVLAENPATTPMAIWLWGVGLG